MKRFAAAAAVAALALSLPTLATAGSTEPPGALHGDVEVLDNSFDPFDLTVETGKTVVWAHEGANPHTVTADDNAFESGTMFNGQTFEHTFADPGTYSYYCRVHGNPGGSGMAGVITVVDPVGPQPTTIDALGAGVTPGAINVSGVASFRGEFPNTVTEDPAGDAPIVPSIGDATGVDLLKATIYQPDPNTPELWFDWHMTALPPTGSLPEVVRYTAPFKIGTSQWQLQANLTNWTSVTVLDDPEGSVRGPGHFRLRGNCTTSWNGTPVANCPMVAWLTGEFLPEDKIARIKIPVGVTPAFVPGAKLERNVSSNANLQNVITGYQAFVALSPTTNDEAPWGGDDETFAYTIPLRTVRLGIVTAGAPAQFTTTGTIGPDGASFSGSLSTAGLAPGSYDVWVQACFGTNCATQKVTITI